MAFERFFEDLSYGHEFFVDQAFWLVEISKTSRPFFFFAIVISLGLECELQGRGFGLIFESRILVSRLKWSLH